MSTTTDEPQHAARTPASLSHTPARTTTMVLLAFAAVYLVWGSTYLAIRIGVESFPPLILAGLRHLTVGVFLYPILRRTPGLSLRPGTGEQPSLPALCCYLLAMAASVGRS